MLMILNVEYCLKFCFLFRPVDCCSVVYRLCHWVQRA